MKCKKHPKYKGIYKPRVDCEKCWKIYEKNKKPPIDETLNYPTHFYTPEMRDRLSGY